MVEIFGVDGESIGERAWHTLCTNVCQFYLLYLLRPHGIADSHLSRQPPQRDDVLCMLA